jgi:superfamily II DNA or RNA helicase
MPKSVATHVLTGGEKPAFEGGLTIATEQSMISRGLEDRGRYGLVIVDEAHHAPADGYRKLLEQLEPAYMLGMTATPWRGDERQLQDIFGDPVFAMSIVDGMQMGYLADVDYRMLIDDIDWEWVQSSLHGLFTVRDLNRRLFVPERDEAVIAKIREHLSSIRDPRCIIFCRSIDHADTIFKALKADGVRCLTAHSRMDAREVTKTLHLYRSRAANVLVTVDMLNEGIDLPDVNLIVFLRVTHSRRIFLQQLGRGLRLAPGKSTVRVLDFISDIRRVSEALDLNKMARDWADRAEPGQVTRYPTGAIVKFEGDESLNFFREYLHDVSELTDSDQVRLKFP